MRSFSIRLGCVLGVWMGVLAASTLADGQQNTSKYAPCSRVGFFATAPPAKKSTIAPPAKKSTIAPPARGAIHRIELYSGTRRSVRYLPSGTSPTPTGRPHASCNAPRTRKATFSIWNGSSSSTLATSALPSRTGVPCKKICMAGPSPANKTPQASAGKVT